MTYRLFGANPGGLDEFPPAVQLERDERCELGLRAARRIDTMPDEAIADVTRLQRFHHFSVEAARDRARDTCRCEKAIPERDVVIAQARLREARYLRRSRRARFRGNRDAFDLACFHHRQRWR